MVIFLNKYKENKLKDLKKKSTLVLVCHFLIIKRKQVDGVEKEYRMLVCFF